ncbi:Pyridoxamine 5'-phosphate oxidase-related FMN-binding protein OS=Tsukamurella paurometabola (strain ATCC 8368 / DSM / CCUG 35730 / CIP 100753 / JCM 10117/ KCTC 9821 / NBRC 16120 / NCIMB 702349 / NCTC 13040) OX=521096 GN=Tpau_2727 PE=4 SV=1 [Tsukamurella paurometabola]|uniref:Pyridoxamine 5'-phosphate oxidase-related FMN-binding protein n=1 Tax=Tsukamurella paurometabola (strain ATCC 8368 / DSM 20162 / CCUG 35730 / CIP 100753 / JCM 10117 / KCTC 9821 / NBRC 16120 / NCIMB 702349 / NCTC 13040) TaxID=521096 RepID=D5USQ4_TSUPD|nr:pyridoxamine 5'-phosphate oxidase family protein [Tsukamurella paurometabola]ADG79325.1 pyridoxamine 5'-phosphate oxidase-related FMN- binding protein [Tsukamurella paurometabola DSM 20162]SUP35092.1 PPOX class probable F420-dependent enzyme [Tsukamurella paurometabola]
MALTASEKQHFLAEPHVAAFSIAEQGRGPLTVPVWYAYEPGGKPWITISPHSRKMRAISDAGRFSLMVDTVTPRTMYVTVEGPVSELRPSTDEEIYAMAARYLQGAELDGYLAFADQLGEHATVVLEPEHWLGADLTM